MNPKEPYSLMAELARVKGKGPPPIHLWHPDNVKDIDMEIKANGDWYYLGTPIERPRLVHLFASVLRREGDDYYLVTPVEKCRIRIEDVPFQVVSLAVTGEGDSQQVQFTTNMAEDLLLDADHPLRFSFDPETNEPSPYVMVRDGLEARLNRNTYYHLAELLTEHQIDATNWLGVWSCGSFFKVMEA